MNENRLVPKIRQEIAYQILKFEEVEYIKLIDTQGFTDKQPMFPLFIMEIIQIANENVTENQLFEIIKTNFADYAQDVFNNVMEIIDALDEYGFMEGENFEILKSELAEYENSPIRPSVCSGSSFSENPEEADLDITSILNASSESSFDGLAIALAIPHIDFRLNDSHKAYSMAINSIKNTESPLYVIIGTSHFGNSDYFMFCDKHFETPFGLAETDIDLISTIKEKYPELTIDNKAHRDEHSIEYQVVLLKKALKHDFKILPILAGSVYDYIDNEKMPLENPQYLKMIQAIKESIYNKYPDAVILASGDMAHIGKRFNDDYPARQELDNLKIDDSELIKSLEKCDSSEFLKQIVASKDKWKICGTAPFYAMLNIANPEKGIFLDYQQWDDFMTESAVSYASIAYK
jgi:AmmeMemoRadiSam system protein B